eukprot:Skav222380  [mRNA]  locus=scaffold2692:346935:349451:- [translate_table: standard]
MAEITEFTGVQLCQDEPVLTTTPVPSACLCVFDVDRTLTGKQGLAEGSQCPDNRLVDGVRDTAYGGGTLTLSAAGQNLNKRPGGSPGIPMVSAGDAGGDGSELRRVLLRRVLRSETFDEFRKAVDGILEWYRQQGVSIQPEKVHFFGDRTENIGPFGWKGYNAREISCKERDYSIRNGMVGLCGAALEEIVDTPGIAQCSGRRLLSV